MSELYRLIHAEKATHPIVLLWRVPKVARSSFYAWCEGEAARRARQAADDALAHEITAVHIASRHTYGVPASTRNCAGPAGEPQARRPRDATSPLSGRRRTWSSRSSRSVTRRARSS